MNDEPAWAKIPTTPIANEGAMSAVMKHPSLFAWKGTQRPPWAANSGCRTHKAATTAARLTAYRAVAGLFFLEAGMKPRTERMAIPTPAEAAQGQEGISSDRAIKYWRTMPEALMTAATVVLNHALWGRFASKPRRMSFFKRAGRRLARG